MDKLEAGHEIGLLKDRVAVLEETVDLIVEMAGPEALEKVKAARAEAQAKADEKAAKDLEKAKKARSKEQAEAHMAEGQDSNR